MKNVGDTSESQKQVDWKLTNKLISPSQQHKEHTYLRYNYRDFPKC